MLSSGDRRMLEQDQVQKSERLGPPCRRPRFIITPACPHLAKRTDIPGELLPSAVDLHHPSSEQAAIVAGPNADILEGTGAVL